jgi:hypothetical protein
MVMVGHSGITTQAQQSLVSSQETELTELGQIVMVQE